MVIGLVPSALWVSFSKGKTIGPESSWRFPEPATPRRTQPFLRGVLWNTFFIFTFGSRAVRSGAQVSGRAGCDRESSPLGSPLWLWAGHSTSLGPFPVGKTRGLTRSTPSLRRSHGRRCLLGSQRLGDSAGQGREAGTVIDTSILTLLLMTISREYSGPPLPTVLLSVVCCLW